jgi:hypothetical protein
MDFKLHGFTNPAVTPVRHVDAAAFDRIVVVVAATARGRGDVLLRARRSPSAFDPGLYLRLRVHGKLLLSGHVGAAAGPFSSSKVGRTTVRLFCDDYPRCQDVDAFRGKR